MHRVLTSLLLSLLLLAPLHLTAEEPAAPTAQAASSLKPAIAAFQPIARVAITGAAADETPTAKPGDGKLHAYIRVKNLYKLDQNRRYEAIVSSNLDGLRAHTSSRKAWIQASYASLRLSEQELATAGITPEMLARGLMVRVIPDSLLPNKDSGAKWRVRIEPLKKSKVTSR